MSVILIGFPGIFSITNSARTLSAAASITLFEKSLFKTIFINLQMPVILFRFAIPNNCSASFVNL